MSSCVCSQWLHVERLHTFRELFVTVRNIKQMLTVVERMTEQSEVAKRVKMNVFYCLQRGFKAGTTLLCLHN